jgi:hypothetical protein
MIASTDNEILKIAMTYGYGTSTIRLGAGADRITFWTC